jgi:hypothetical protein
MEAQKHHYADIKTIEGLGITTARLVEDFSPEYFGKSGDKSGMIEAYEMMRQAYRGGDLFPGSWWRADRICRACRIPIWRCSTQAMQVVPARLVGKLRQVFKVGLGE